MLRSISSASCRSRAYYYIATSLHAPTIAARKTDYDCPTTAGRRKLENHRYRGTLTTSMFQLTDLDSAVNLKRLGGDPTASTKAPAKVQQRYTRMRVDRYVYTYRDARNKIYIDTHT